MKELVEIVEKNKDKFSCLDLDGNLTEYISSYCGNFVFQVFEDYYKMIIPYEEEVHNHPLGPLLDEVVRKDKKKLINQSIKNFEDGAFRTI